MIAIGIDVGGTSIKGGAVDSTGKLFDIFTCCLKKEEKAEEVLERLALIIKDYVKNHKFNENISGIGMGIPGAINSETGVVDRSPNLPLWEHVNVVKIMEELTGLPVKITNDANAAAFGEAKFGSDTQYNTAIMITLGTGVGGGIIINGKLFEGNEGKGAELGHTTLVLGGRQCSCGRKGCFEAYASATGLINETKQVMEEHPESKMNDVAIQFGGVNAQVPFLAEKLYEDEWAKYVVKQYVMYLSEGLLNFCNIFRPDVIILSGGVANQGENLLGRVRTYLKEKDFGFKGAPEVKITQGSLGYDSGKIGAAALFFDK